MANSVDLDEVAHYEPPHPDLSCLQIQLLLSLVLKELTLFIHIFMTREFLVSRLSVHFHKQNRAKPENLNQILHCQC